MAFKTNHRSPLPATPPAPKASTQAIARGGLSEVPTRLPQLRVLDAKWSDVPVPAGVDFAGKAAWLRFGSWEPQAEGEFSVSGAHFQMLPCDVSGVGRNGVAAPDAATWGDIYGESAAIVVGVNLPGALMEWTPALAPFAGLGSASSSRFTAMPGPDYIAVQEFPPGKLSDALPWKRDVPRSFGVNAYRVGLGRRLDVALVVNPTQGATPLQNAATPLTLCGAARVSIHLQLVQVGSPFGTA